MERRFCVEVDLDEMFFTVHDQKCLNYPHAEFLPLNRVVDLGAHRDSREAVRQARQDFPVPWHLAQCRCLV